MKKLYFVATLILVATSQLSAQEQRMDTIVLSVYNTSQRFQLYPMPFGAATPASGFTAEMVASLDTVNVLREVPDSAGNLAPRGSQSVFAAKFQPISQGKSPFCSGIPPATGVPKCFMPKMQEPLRW